MISKNHDVYKKHFSQFRAISGFLFIFFIAGCSPHLTAQDRSKDIEFLAQWAKDCHPLVELDQKYKGLPNCADLKPKYVQLAEKAKNNEEFFKVVYGYFNLISASGHGFLLSGLSLDGYMLEALFHGGITSDIPWYKFPRASYWAKLFEDRCYVHPPFRIVRRENEYFTRDDWHSKGRTIPAGSRIRQVNGMTCSGYVDRLKEQTWLRYMSGNVDWITKNLLVVNEGKGFRGWKVDFLCPDGTMAEMFVPYKKGLSSRTSEFTDWGKNGNCVCVELTCEVGYIRVKSMGGIFIKNDRKKISEFLERSGGKYGKLVIDIRHNSGGLVYYGCDNLIRPFLDQTVVYKQTTGIKRKILTRLGPQAVQSLRRGVSTWAYDLKTEEINPPEGFDGDEWVFYEITRELKPSDRYNFSGDIYVLIDGGTASAADNYANDVRRIGYAKLVGQRTYGSAGAYFNPVLVRLPASGMIFVLEADLLVNTDGTYNEISGTAPDIELPPCELPASVTKDELLRDEWIAKIVEGVVGGKTHGG
jgi:hypothetical protein